MVRRRLIREIAFGAPDVLPTVRQACHDRVPLVIRGVAADWLPAIKRDWQRDALAKRIGAAPLGLKFGHADGTFGYVGDDFVTFPSERSDTLDDALTETITRSGAKRDADPDALRRPTAYIFSGTDQPAPNNALPLDVLASVEAVLPEWFRALAADGVFVQPFFDEGIRRGVDYPIPADCNFDAAVGTNSNTEVGFGEGGGLAARSLVWLSGGDTRACCHRDSEHNSHVCLAGRKRFALVDVARFLEVDDAFRRGMKLPPAEEDPSASNGTDCRGTGCYDVPRDAMQKRSFPQWFTGFSPINLHAPDLDRFPLFAGVEAVEECCLEPGDMLYMPAGWYHDVKSEIDEADGKDGMCLAINFWQTEMFGLPSEEAGFVERRMRYMQARHLRDHEAELDRADFF
jgi:hypothetical protein